MLEDALKVGFTRNQALIQRVLGVLRLKRRGDSWPWYRTVLWITGLLLLAYINFPRRFAWPMH